MYILLLSCISLNVCFAEEHRISLGEEMATHSSILAWEIPWIEEPGRLQSMGLQKAGHNSVTEHALTHKISLYLLHMKLLHISRSIFHNPFIVMRNHSMSIQWALILQEFRVLHQFSNSPFCVSFCYFPDCESKLCPAELQ